MKEKYITKRFNTASRKLLVMIDAIIEKWGAMGYDLSLRQLYYQLVSANAVENTEQSYKNVGKLVSDARLAGLLEWDIFVDRGRGAVHGSHWENPAGIIRSARYGYNIDHWKNQAKYLEVMVEKQALEGVLTPVCAELDVPFSSNKGYTSSTAMRDTAKRFIRASQAGKSLHMIYLGDHDPSGIDMTRDINDRLKMFTHGLKVKVHRVALNMDQVREWKLPPNPAKMSDSRAPDYVAKFGNESWELDAISPDVLAKMVSEKVNSMINRKEWEKTKRTLKRDQRILIKLEKHWPEVAKFAGKLKG